MPPRALLLAACLTVHAGTGAAEANLTGNQLLSACDDTANLAAQGFCIGYIIGALEGMTWGAAVPAIGMGANTEATNRIVQGLLGFCLPEGPTYGQYQDIVVARLRANPETRHWSARMLIQQAMVEAFTCPAE